MTQIPRASWFLLYADDILIFAKATHGNIQRMQQVLSEYGRLSGQPYNPAKSKVYFGSAVSRRVRNDMLRTTGISAGSLPFSYLGVPIFRGAPHTGHLAALADSIIGKFSKWKGHSLSLAGRKCMVNFLIADSLVHSMMVYYWPRSLLKKIENAMRNFLWLGDISKKSNSCSISWARFCSPLRKERLGIHSLRIANDSFVCKLAWDILCNKSSIFYLLHDQYLTPSGRPRSYSRVSSIWPRVHRQMDPTFCWFQVVGQSSSISFWNDNWLGYIISDKIGIPANFAALLTITISDYFHDEQWHFDYDFFMKHTDIVKDILKIHVLRDMVDRVWGSSVSGQLTSRMAYDIVGWASWIWGSFIPPRRSTLIWRAIWGKLPTADWLRHFGVHGPTVCFLCHNNSESLDHNFAHCSFFRNLLCKFTALFDITLYYDIGFLDVFLQATTFQFGKQISDLWRIAFITSLWSPSVHRSLAYILASIKESAPIVRGHIVGSVRELIILGRLGISGHSAPVLTTTVIHWKPPHADWIKVNVDGSAPSSPGPLFVGAIFRNSRGFFMAAFSNSVGWGYPLEAELAAILHAILFAFDRGWHSLWVESDSILAIQTMQKQIQIIPWRLQGL
ncbi:hypothetical protein ACS0TY_023916 [Phlomoides rotata]